VGFHPVVKLWKNIVANSMIFYIKNLQKLKKKESFKKVVKFARIFTHGSITQPKIYKDFFIFFNSRI